MLPDDAEKILTDVLKKRREWLLVNSNGKSFALQTAEIELDFSRGKLFLGFPDDKGFQSWRVSDFEMKEEKILLGLTRNFEKEQTKVTLVPRISAFELGEAAELARREKAQKLAALAAEEANAKIVRAELNRETGRFAQIVLENRKGIKTAVLADVTNGLTPEILLSAAILWLEKLQNRRKNPIVEISVLAGKKQARAVRRLHALLRENWRKKIRLKEIFRPPAPEKNEPPNADAIFELQPLQISDLWREKARKIQPFETPRLSEAAQRIIEFAPVEIDAVFSRRGETLRFRGLPFARVRKISGAEKVWFGIENERRLLSEETFDDFVKLIDELKIYRCFESPNRRHAFYRLAPEAWLESVLRQNIKLLDANLILSPLYHQFRADREKIDLLALREDNRLVIIELKTAPDRAGVFQAADYWRKIELARRSGNLQKAAIFGADAKIKDEPALVFLAAPTLAFHRDFAFTASTISDEIEIYRFDLNEDWRRAVKVLQRNKI